MNWKSQYQIYNSIPTFYNSSILSTSTTKSTGVVLVNIPLSFFKRKMQRRKLGEQPSLEKRLSRGQGLYQLRHPYGDTFLRITELFIPNQMFFARNILCAINITLNSCFVSRTTKVSSTSVPISFAFWDNFRLILPLSHKVSCCCLLISVFFHFYWLFPSVFLLIPDIFPIIKCVTFSSSIKATISFVVYWLAQKPITLYPQLQQSLPIFQSNQHQRL